MSVIHKNPRRLWRQPTGILFRKNPNQDGLFRFAESNSAGNGQREDASHNGHVHHVAGTGVRDVFVRSRGGRGVAAVTSLAGIDMRVVDIKLGVRDNVGAERTGLDGPARDLAGIFAVGELVGHIDEIAVSVKLVDVASFRIRGVIVVVSQAREVDGIVELPTKS